MDFQLLGPFEARYDGAPVDLGRRRERCLLGVLLLDVGRVVPLTRLAALLWDDDPPDNARGMLQTHVSRLRSRLDPDRDGRYGVRLVSRGGGYLVETDADRVDVHRFRTLLESAGRIASPAERAAGLRQALDLWHGPLLADVAPDRLRERIGTGLVELRLSAWESWAEAGLAAGAHRAVLPELTDLVEEYPARERLTAALMRALFHDGRQPDALSVYRRVRDRLADEYGLDPGPALARLHDEMLRSPAPGTAPDAAFTAPVPAQLPGEAAYFTGRGPEVARLDETVRAGMVVLSAVSGAAGVGKTALAVHWAHRVRDRFPDGQLFADLRGFAPGAPVRPADVLARFLRALGVPAERVPADPDEATGLYRSLLADRRVLVVLDNAADAEQVRPLLPGSRSCLVVVTSRDRLSGLVALEGAHRVDVDELPAADAVALLGRVLGADRLAAEPDAVDALAVACGHLPLALRIAAANLAGRPEQTVAGYVDQLVTHRLAALRVDSDQRATVRASFDLSYHSRPEPARRLFRLLSLAPGDTVGVSAAAALADLTPAGTAPLLDSLHGAHLLVATGPDRYGCHDLIREYAAERLTAEETADDREAAVERLVDWYQTVAELTNDVLTPNHQALAAVVKWRPAEPPFAAGPHEVHAFLRAETPTLPHAVRFATEHGHHHAAAAMTYLLAGYFEYTVDVDEALAVSHWGLTAARRLGDPSVEVVLRFIRAGACNLAHRPQEALEVLDGVPEMARRLGNPRAEANAYNNAGRALRKLGRYADAIEAYRRALVIFTAEARPVAAGMVVNNIGNVHLWTGDLDAAYEWLSRAHAHWQTTGDRLGEVRTLTSLGRVHVLRGDPDAATAALLPAVELARDVEAREQEADGLHLLGEADLQRADPAAAIGWLDRALSLAHASGNRYQAAAVQATLGVAHLRAGHLDRAREHLDTAGRLNAAVPDDATVQRLREAWAEYRDRTGQAGGC